MITPWQSVELDAARAPSTTPRLIAAGSRASLSGSSRAGYSAARIHLLSQGMLEAALHDAVEYDWDGDEGRVNVEKTVTGLIRALTGSDAPEGLARLKAIEVTARALVDAWHSGEEGPLYLALKEAVYG